jgi:ABC-2 type transport system permease protein
MKIQIPNYTMFLFTALIPWTFFITTVSQSSLSIIMNSNLIKKIYFPREIIPISVVTSNTVNFLISCIIMLVFIFITRLGISWYILLFPLVLFAQYLLLVSIALILSSITVYARDLEHIVGVLLTALFYTTPIVYSMEMVPNEIRSILLLNPMTTIISSYRDILFYKQMPDLEKLFILIIISFISFVIGLKIFSKLQRNFAEEM